MATTVAEAFVTLRPDLKGFTGEAERGIGGPLKKLAGVVGGLFAAKLGTDFLRGTVDAASDLNETISKSNTIFGSAAAEVDKWARGAAKGIGQSRQQALDAAATFGNMFSQLGIGADQTAGMSRQMVELASDFASFHNADISEVIAAQTAAFRGEYDAVQRFVPTINAAAVEQKALALTGKTATKELTLQEKALATQALLMENAGAAAGDFARTSDGLANKQRILSAQFENAKASIGQALLPVVTRLTSFFADKLPGAIDTTRRAFSFIGGAVRQIAEILLHRDFVGGGPFAEDSKFIAGVFRFRDVFVEDVLPVLRRVADFVSANLKPILIGLGAAFITITSPITAVAAGLVLAYTRFEGFRDAVDAVAKFLTKTAIPAVADFATVVGDHIGALVDYVKRIWPQVSEAIGHVLAVSREIIERFIQVVTFLWGLWGDNITKIAQTVFDTVKRVIEAALGVIRGIIQTVLAVINGDWGKAWDGLKQIASGVIDAVKAVLRGLVSYLGELAKIVYDAALVIGKKIAEGIIDGLKKFGGGIGDALKDLLPDFPTSLRMPRFAFADGGMVPGPIGAPVPAIVHGGELILNPRQQAAMSAGGGINVNITAPTLDADDVARAAVIGLRKLQYEGVLD